MNSRRAAASCSSKKRSRKRRSKSASLANHILGPASRQNCTTEEECSATRVQPFLNLLHPGLTRHEAGAASAHGFGAAKDLVVGPVEVERLAAGLRRIERRIDVEFYGIALGILEVERPGIAVVGHAMVG